VPVPPGAAGEIHVGGVGVGRGYRDDPRHTAEAFVPDPFTAARGARLYRSGDLGRWSRVGSLEFLGRIDHQVKVRGFRVELGEVEAALGRLDGLREAVVLAPGDQRLAAFVVPEAGHEVDPAALRAALAETLPEYMVPSAFTVLSELPLTPNGKVDRADLARRSPAAGDVRSDLDYVAPRTDDERRLAEIWAELLDRGEVGVHDNFFALGGHSLLAMQIISRARSGFGVDLPLRRLFQEPTVAGLAGAIAQARDEGRRDEAPAIRRLSREAHRVRRGPLEEGGRR
jgi:acyl carrier protein